MHTSWLADRPNRTFDVLLVHYGENANYGLRDADYYAARKGLQVGADGLCASGASPSRPGV